jgi:hypothetical protein
MAIGVLHRPFQGLRELGDGEFGRIEQGFRRRHRQTIRHFGVDLDVKDFRRQARILALSIRVLCSIEFSIVDPVRDDAIAEDVATRGAGQS